MTQTVADTDSGVSTSEGDQGAQGLDDLLKEYDQKTTQETGKTEEQTDIKRVLDYVERQEQKEAATELKAALNSSYESIGKELSDLPVTGKALNTLIRGKLELMAEEDPRVMKAFNDRKNNPRAWDAIQKKAANELRNDFTVVDSGATESREAMMAAVRGASKYTEKAPPPVEKQSDGQFRQTLREMGLGG